MAKFESMQSVFRSSLKPRARLVLQCLVLHCNQAGECFPSIKTIAAECGYGISTVKRALDELLEAGSLKKAARIDQRKNGGQTSNLYTLCDVRPEPEKKEKRIVHPSHPEEPPQQEGLSGATAQPTPRETCAHTLIYSFAEGIKKGAERLCPASLSTWTAPQPILVPP